MDSTVWTECGTFANFIYCADGKTLLDGAEAEEAARADRRAAWNPGPGCRKKNLQKRGSRRIVCPLRVRWMQGVSPLSSGPHWRMVGQQQHCVGSVTRFSAAPESEPNHLKRGPKAAHPNLNLKQKIGFSQDSGSRCDEMCGSHYSKLYQRKRKKKRRKAAIQIMAGNKACRSFISDPQHFLSL